MTTVEAIREDREAGAKRLEREYKPMLVNAAMKLGLDETEAESFAYMAMEEAIHSIDRFDSSGLSSFKAWICSILKNLVCKDARRLERSKVDFVSDLPEPDSAESVNPDGREIAAAVDAGVLRTAIESLPGDMREAIVLHYFLDLPLGKIAKLLSLPIGTVKSRLHYARILLSKRLGICRLVVILTILSFAFIGVASVIRYVSGVWHWLPGSSMSRFDDPANWKISADGASSGESLPGGHSRLCGSGDYAFDMNGTTNRTLMGIETPKDWDDHTFAIANGALAFSGAVSTHTGEMVIDEGGVLTLLRDSSFAPAVFSAGKWRVCVKRGGTFNLLGCFCGYSYSFCIEPGGRCVIDPQFWGGHSASEQRGNIIENSGELFLPNGLIWRSGGAAGELYDVRLRQADGVLVLGGSVGRSHEAKNRVEISVELAGGEIRATGDVSFDVDKTVIVGAIRAVAEKGARLDLRGFSLADGACVEVGGEGDVLLPAKRELSAPKTITVEAGETLKVPAGTKFGNVVMVVRGVIEAQGEGDLVFGYAENGETAPFGLTVDGGTIRNAGGDIDFFCPQAGGAVVPLGTVTLKDATLETAEGCGFNFGVHNPENTEVNIDIKGTRIEYGAGSFRIGGGVRMNFSEKSALFRPDKARQKADLVVKELARLYFGPGTDFHYGASANGFGSVGNGGVSFIPSQEGYPALVIDGASFWYHHPNAMRGAARATICLTNAVYEMRAMNWNFSLPFRGFADVAGELVVRPTEGTGKFAWDGSDDPQTLLKQPLNKEKSK